MDIQNLKDPHIAVISDIHGNYVALERCLDHAASNQANAYLFLGDYVSELAYPERTMRLLYETAQKYPCMFIRGNKEDYWFQFRDRGGDRLGVWELHQRRFTVCIQVAHFP